MEEGYGLLELHPEMTLSFSRGKSERWDFTPFDRIGGFSG